MNSGGIYVNHRHLLPNEIDLLVDEDGGFGAAPLKAHLRDCPACRSRLDDARITVDALEELVHFAPSHRFSERVMAEVAVFVPWHAAVRDSIQAWVPRSRPVRAAFLAFGTATSLILTIGLLWIATRTDLLVFATELISGRAKALVGGGIQDAAAALFGEQLFMALRQAGPVALALMLAAIFGSVVAAIAGLRLVATASSRRRS